MLFRSMPSSKPSSIICLIISSSISCESSSEELSSDRKLDWCSICLAGCISLDEDGSGGFLLVDLSSLIRLSLELRLPSLLLSVLLLLPSLGGSRLVLALGIPTSLKLSCCTSSNTLLSSSAPGSSLRRSLGNTLSPGLYFSRSTFFSVSDFPRPGFAFTNMSRRVVTVALGCVVRTEARQDGHV